MELTIGGDEMSNTELFGLQTASQYRPLREALAMPAKSDTGNVIIRIAREIEAEGNWSQVGTVVMTKSEARKLAENIINQTT